MISTDQALEILNDNDRGVIYSVEEAHDITEALYIWAELLKENDESRKEESYRIRQSVDR